MDRTDGGADEGRRQRHEFILHYYDMAVKDLDRHLKGGWETVATAVGVLATLAAAEQGYLPVPVAVSAAFLVCFWGINNILDADYWARRAIAFLANVEAVYFTLEDRKVFNPYAGRHPSLRILDSLTSQLYAVIGLLAVSGMFFIWKVATVAGGIEHVGTHLAELTYLSAAFWTMPLLVGLWFAKSSVGMRYKRTRDYLQFVRTSPGPGMVKAAGQYRGVDFSREVGDDQIVPGEEIQRDVRERLVQGEARWCWLNTMMTVLSWAVSGAVVILLALRGKMFGG